MAVEVRDQVARDEIAALLISMAGVQSALADLTVPLLDLVSVVAPNVLEFLVTHTLDDNELFWDATTNWASGVYEISRNLNSILLGFTGESPPDGSGSIRVRLSRRRT